MKISSIETFSNEFVCMVRVSFNVGGQGLRYFIAHAPPGRSDLLGRVLDDSNAFESDTESEEDALNGTDNDIPF